MAGAGLDLCEAAENTLTRRLAGVDRDTLPPGLAAELADAEQSVLIARRVHNDAVRDTLDLRSRRLVRWLRLAGTAPAPPTSRSRSPRSGGRPPPGPRRPLGLGWDRPGPPDVPSVGRTGGNRRPGGAVGPANRSDGACAGRPEYAGPARADPREPRGKHRVARPDPVRPPQLGTSRVKRGMAEMLKGGVIMDVVTPEQAKIAEDAGAVAVMALERVPADIRAQGGVARMSDPDMVEGIIDAVSIPVMAKARIGHFVEAQVLQSLGVDYVDESEVLTPADEAHHIDKWAFTVPFVCGATNLGEALRRIAEGAAMIRSKGEAGTGNVVEATRHMRAIRADIRRLGTLDADGAVRRGQGAARPVRAGGRGGAGRQAAGGAVHRRRHRDPGRRGDDDAAGRRGRVRRVRASSSPATPPGGPTAIVKATTFYDDPGCGREGLPRAAARPWWVSTSRTSLPHTGSPTAAGDRSYQPSSLSLSFNP